MAIPGAFWVLGLGMGLAIGSLLTSCSRPPPGPSGVRVDTGNSLPPLSPKPSGGPGQVRPAITKVTFRGEPQGGEVKLVFTVTEPPTVVRVQTVPAQSPLDVATAVASAVNDISDPDFRLGRITATKADGPVVVLTTGEESVYLCTTDSGLKVPPTPQHLVATRNNGVTTLTWEIPDGGYDRIHVLRSLESIATDLPGTTTSFSDQLPVLWSGTYTYRVFGVKDQTPSCAATVRVLLQER